jgi:hypothetical protein
MRVVPLTLSQANALVARLHRHHKPVTGHRFSIGAEADGRLVGAAIIGRPVARMTDQYHVAEVTRLVSDGTRNACSILYAAAARAADAMGFDHIQTFILESEPGTSLRAAGWHRDGSAGGGDWERTSGSRRGQLSLDGRINRDDQPMGGKVRWSKQLRAPDAVR